MRKVEPYLWCCKCGATHDERDTVTETPEEQFRMVREADMGEVIRDCLKVQ